MMIEKTPNQTDVIVVSSSASEMVESQLATINALKAKREQAAGELAEANEMIASAKMAAITDEAPRRLAAKAQARIEFIDKAVDALEAGYVMMPAIPGDVIVVRVADGRTRSVAGDNDSWYGARAAKSGVGQELCDDLPSGEGKYADVRPNTQIEHRQAKRYNSDKEDSELTTAITTTIRPWSDLPVAFMKPTVIERIKDAMDHLIFDEILISPGRRATADPLVIGVVKMRSKRGEYFRARRLHFLIAHFIDTRDI